MKTIIIASLVLLITGCATTLQTGAISEAYKKYKAQNYEDTLKLISLANNVKETRPETRAELTYLNAQTYE